MDSSPSVSTGVVQTLSMLALVLRIHTNLRIDISRPLNYMKDFPNILDDFRVRKEQNVRKPLSF